MNYDDIKRRIKQRRYASLLNENNYSHKETKKKRSFLSFCTSIMTILVLTLGILIYAKKDEKGKFIQETFGIKINFGDCFSNKVYDFEIYDDEGKLVKHHSKY